MFKIFIVESRHERQLVLQGSVVDRAAIELRNTCERARAELHDRQLIIQVRNLTAISQQGENVLLQLMQDGIQFRGYGVFAKHVLSQIAKRASNGQSDGLGRSTRLTTK